MAENKQQPRALLTFYILVIYVLVQFFWWSYLMINQSQEIFNRKMELVSVSASPAEAITKHDALRKELVSKWYMVAGEGSVFIVILALGVIMVRRSFRKESELIVRQNTFLHSITHEFKSPVASMRLQLETLQKRSLSPDQQQKALVNAIEDTERLDMLIEKTLVAARIDNGELPLHIEFMNLSEKLKETTEQISRSYPGRTITSNIQHNISLHIDPWALNSIYTNLLENALLYSPTDKAITVSLTSTENMIKLSVQDSGVGIPDKEKKKVFQKFYRSNATQGYKGTGLGLFIVNYFVKMHKGKIEVKNNSPEGSIFEVSFPTNKTNGSK